MSKDDKPECFGDFGIECLCSFYDSCLLETLKGKIRYEIQEQERLEKWEAMRKNAHTK
jgi:hypothetical protein